jgi:sulfate permease, SulP family
MLKPKLITILQKGYSFSLLRTDIMAGIIVGVVALPLAIAFAIASGVSPDKGLITAVIAGFLISALGGSRVQIGGPTGAFVVIVYGILAKYGFDGLTIATLMAGIILIIFGLTGVGSVIKFIPQPVTVGFTSGIALIIFSSQMKDFFGMHIAKLPADFIEKWISYFANLSTINLYAVALGAGTILFMILWEKKFKKIPGSLIAMIFITLIVHFLKLPVETIGSYFGNIPNSIPSPRLPHISFHIIKELMSPAFTIALLAGIESLLSAMVADGMIGTKHRSNMELVAQGAANIGSSIFGGIPATGAIARTAVNVHNGGRSPIAGIVHAITLFLIMIFLGKWAVLIPMPCLAGILIIVAYRMSEWRSFAMLLKSPKTDVIVLCATFTLTVLIDLSVAIQIGMILAAFLFVYRLSMTTNIKSFTKDFADDEEQDDPNAISKRDVPDYVEIFEINGPFFFGMVSSFNDTMQNIEKKPKVKILRMRNVLTIDASAINAIRQNYKFCKKHNITFILSEVHAQPLFALEHADLLNEIGLDRAFGNIDDALNCSREILGLEKIERTQPFVPAVKREKK